MFWSVTNVASDEPLVHAKGCRTTDLSGKQRYGASLWPDISNFCMSLRIQWMEINFLL